jgi:uncharacterized protein
MAFSGGFISMRDWLAQPWPWYVAGPLIGLMVPWLLFVGNRLIGMSSNLRHVCAAAIPGGLAYFRYDWRGAGSWNLALALGTAIGGLVAGTVLASPAPVAIAETTLADLRALGVTDFSRLVPGDLFSWSALLSPQGLILVLGGGFLVGFGTAYAGGCTSGHGLAGVADLQLPSLLALVSFFIGGMLATFLILPMVLGG